MIVSLFVAASLSAAAPEVSPSAPSSIAPSHAVVAAFERFHGAVAAKVAPLPQAGRLLLGELNCAACHKLDDRLREFVALKQAPRLTNVADRVRPEWLRTFLTDPQQAKPGTTMPDALAGLPPHEKQRRVEALAHFLASAGSGGLFDTYVDAGAVRRGEQLFHEVGCAACHGSRKPKARPLPFAVPLGEPAKKYTAETLAAFLRDPHQARPSGRMPSLLLKDQEAIDIATYLLREVVAEPNLNYALYHGNWERLPNFDTLRPVETGRVAGFDLAVAKRSDQFGLRFEGYLKVEKEDDYRFRTGSDDGTRLYVDGQLVVENDGIHPVSMKEARSRLKAGMRLVRVDYFEAGGGEEIAVDIQLPGNKTWRGLASLLTPTPDAQRKAKPSFAIDEALAVEGRRVFESSGCAVCHEMKLGDRRLPSTVAAPAFDKFQANATRDCLSTAPAANVPAFALSAAQRGALASAVAWARDGARQTIAGPTPQERLQTSLAAFNCYACHQRDGRGGVDPNKTLDLDDDGFPDFDPTSELLSPLFVGTTPEMGDEGRLPPRLDGVGAKLTEAYLKQVLERGAKDRPYVKTVMPNFGGGNVGRLVGLFQELDAPHTERLAELDEPPLRSKSEGRLLVGTKGFGCVKCHQFNKQKAEGIQGIDMTIITRRVRPEWFVRYVTNPQSLRPGTRMPTIFPEGKSPLKDVERGDPQRQVSAMWAFLSDGERAATPVGVGGEPIELVAGKEPVLYRNFIEGAGSRAIGVGYPERLNLAFDAENLRPALVWRGAFIDAARHWVGRGSGFQGPLGDEILPLPQGAAWAVLKSSQDSWPARSATESGLRFRGYRLGADRRPTFHYTLADGTRVDDFYRPTTGGVRPNLERRIALSERKANGGELYFRAAVGKRITPLDGDWFEIDGLWRVRIVGGAGRPIVRNGAGGRELIVPLGADDRDLELIEEINW